MFFIPLTLAPYIDPRNNSYGSYGSYGSPNDLSGAISSYMTTHGAGGTGAVAPVMVPEPPPQPPPQQILVAVHNIVALQPMDVGCTVSTTAGQWIVNQTKDEILGLIDAMYRSAQRMPAA